MDDITMRMAQMWVARAPQSQLAHTMREMLKSGVADRFATLLAEHLDWQDAVHGAIASLALDRHQRYSVGNWPLTEAEEYMACKKAAMRAEPYGPKTATEAAASERVARSAMQPTPGPASEAPGPSHTP